MRQVLKPHPATPCAAVAGIAVDVERTAPGRLSLRFLARGVTAGLVLPPPAAPARTDELWRHTCFEAFVRRPDEDGYLELNFAPSTQWAAYRFDGYRQGMRPADLEAPEVAVRRVGDELELTASLVLDRPGDWRLGLSAVIEEAGGRMSYWALAHPPERPDFHHADCFALALPAPVSP